MAIFEFLNRVKVINGKKGGLLSNFPRFLKILFGIVSVLVIIDQYPNFDMRAKVIGTLEAPERNCCGPGCREVFSQASQHYDEKYFGKPFAIKRHFQFEHPLNSNKINNFDI